LSHPNGVARAAHLAHRRWAADGIGAIETGGPAVARRRATAAAVLVAGVLAHAGRRTRAVGVRVASHAVLDPIERWTDHVAVAVRRDHDLRAEITVDVGDDRVLVPGAAGVILREQHVT